ncbi:MAG: hypothetical protein JWO38_890 [Gemmataceae bacterium]|nr:hypothetical protein [Gemmataceae bacterium]
MRHNWVTVGEFDDPGEADWEAARLREFGVAARVHDPGADGDEPDPTAVVRVLVAPSDLARAREILADDGAPGDPDPIEDEEPGDGEPGNEQGPVPLSARAEAFEAAYSAAVMGIIFPPFLLRSAWLVGVGFARPGPASVGGVFWLVVTLFLYMGAGLAWWVVVSSFLK